MKIALLADIHGNSVALDAVLADIARSGGVDGYWLLGDLVALGPDPAVVLTRVTALPHAQFIRGNTDRYVSEGDRPPPTPAEVARDPALLPRLVEVERTFTWTQGVLAASGWSDWLRQLPLEFRTTLPDGTRLLAVHASPGRDDGDGFQPPADDAAFAALLSGCDADTICVGHTHLPLQRTVGANTVFNPGAVSLSRTADRHAHYAILEASAAGHAFVRRSVSYDVDRVVAQLETRSHPGRAFIIRHLRASG
ncbi:metallophosphoesterase family protein [Oleiharenicola sp. Vm1]|uniref:metallophosphoesterase family protein n=1 Tax=Oleiharenicola sp. Vm1 TaxID=3398393 RepID=UPI0039F4CF23